MKDRELLQETDEEVLDRLADKMWDIAGEHGFHLHDTSGEIPEDFGRFIANLHGEVTELWEAYRKGDLRNSCDKPGCDLTCAEEELADIVIRAMDTAVQLGISLGRAVVTKAEYNQTRSYQHGGKKA
jgi:NTP pyrophosphatase (non-canonical NTP hydrolase)